MQWPGAGGPKLRTKSPEIDAAGGTALEVISRVQIFGILLILAGIGIYFLTPEERARLAAKALTYLRTERDALFRRWKERGAAGEDETQPREPLALVTFALVLASIWVFARMLFGAGAFSDERTLVAWGANFGPRTTNGEWWRLVVSMFVHSGFFHLVACLCGLIPAAVIVERLVGRVAFTIVYFAAGMFASLATLSEFPVGANVGSSGGIAGIYGLMLALWLWSVIQRAPIEIPRATLKASAPAVAVFLLYSAFASTPGTQAYLAGFIVGFTSGLVLAVGTEERRPEIRRLVAVSGSTLLLAVVFAVPLRGLSDVRPEVARVIALETETATLYETSVKRFTAGAIQARALANIIDEKIAPGLREASTRLTAFEHVPSEHQPLVSAADKYLKLRTESWQMRSAALRTSNMRALQKADRIEWQSLDAFEALKQVALP